MRNLTLSITWTNVLHGIFLNDDDSSIWKVIIWIFWVFSFALLINANIVLSFLCDHHSQVFWLVEFRFQFETCVNVSWVKSAENERMEVFYEHLPRNIERAVVRLEIIVILISQCFCPFWRAKWPIAKPNFLSPRVSHFDNCFSVYFQKLQKWICVTAYQSNFILLVFAHLIQ